MHIILNWENCRKLTCFAKDSNLWSSMQIWLETFQQAKGYKIKICLILVLNASLIALFARIARDWSINLPRFSNVRGPTGWEIDLSIHLDLDFPFSRILETARWTSFVLLRTKSSIQLYNKNKSEITLKIIDSFSVLLREFEKGNRCESVLNKQMICDKISSDFSWNLSWREEMWAEWINNWDLIWMFEVRLGYIRLC